MERGAAFRRPRRAHGACSHTAGRAVPPQIALAVKAETASIGDRGGGSPRGAGLTNTGRRSGAGDGTRAPSRRRGKQKELTPHRARFARDCGE